MLLLMLRAAAMMTAMSPLGSMPTGGFLSQHRALLSVKPVPLPIEMWAASRLQLNRNGKLCLRPL